MADAPYKRFWGPQNEAEFQTFMAFDPNVRAWRTAFQQQHGGLPTIDGGDYDYRAAYLAGNAPRPVQGDTVPHWGSDGKAANHPTMWKQQFMSAFGVDPDTLAEGQASPEMQRFIAERLLAETLMRGGE